MNYIVIIILTFLLIVIIYSCSLAIETEKIKKEHERLEKEIFNKIDSILKNLKEYNDGN